MKGRYTSHCTSNTGIYIGKTTIQHLLHQTITDVRDDRIGVGSPRQMPDTPVTCFFASNVGFAHGAHSTQWNSAIQRLSSPKSMLSDLANVADIPADCLVCCDIDAEEILWQ